MNLSIDLLTSKKSFKNAAGFNFNIVADKFKYFERQFDQEPQDLER